jgi:hypothetical protein
LPSFFFATFKRPALTPSCLESEAIPYELLVITVMIDVGEELKNWDFSFILIEHYRADIACQ